MKVHMWRSIKGKRAPHEAVRACMKTICRDILWHKQTLGRWDWPARVHCRPRRCPSFLIYVPLITSPHTPAPPAPVLWWLLPHGPAGSVEAGKNSQFTGPSAFYFRRGVLITEWRNPARLNVSLAFFHSEISFPERNGEPVVLGVRVLVYLQGALAVVWWLADAPRNGTLFCSEHSLKLL